MSFKTILVNIGVDDPAEPTIQAACDLARRFRAKVIGLCAADAPMPVTYPETDPAVVDVWDQMRAQLKTRFGELHATFDRLTAGDVESEWREALSLPTSMLSKTARVADLVVMCAPRGASTGSTWRAADPGSVILQAGRPVFVLAYGTDHVPLGRAVVAWKDTREARRAVADAIPLLSCASEVTVVTIAEEVDSFVTQGADDVVALLSGHGIQAHSKVIESADEDEKLTEFLAVTGADFVVSGAYGHGRLREWAFGGVTRSLLDRTGIDRFMSN
ncbi:MAG: universal stress protein [Castellaniella sp.]|uniref:universal stress protein n=1 Tax=Castellaniella sp. TaxID=1955812 RepID=UPI00121075D3|nr:universal stress protein [Castellaniella sp.]TAN26696.1 MAG: universal stress protein [Castellaniella sp.]